MIGRFLFYLLIGTQLIRSDNAIHFTSLIFVFLSSEKQYSFLFFVFGGKERAKIVHGVNRPPFAVDKQFKTV
jgi:hypothetical protein